MRKETCNLRHPMHLRHPVVKDNSLPCYDGTHCATYEWVMLHIWMSHVTHTNESCLLHFCPYSCEQVKSHVWIHHTLQHALQHALHHTLQHALQHILPVLMWTSHSHVWIHASLNSAQGLFEFKTMNKVQVLYKQPFAMHSWHVEAKLIVPALYSYFFAMHSWHVKAKFEVEEEEADDTTCRLLKITGL